MTEIIKPQDVTNINKMQPNEIAAFSEQVMQADAVLSDVTEELKELSACLSNLNGTKKAYDEIAKRVKGQMRTMVGKL